MRYLWRGLPRWCWNPPANAGVTGWIPGSGRSPGGGHGNPPQYSCLENPMDRGAQRAVVHKIAKSRTQLKQLSMAWHLWSILGAWLSFSHGRQHVKEPRNRP